MDMTLFKRIARCLIFAIGLVVLLKAASWAVAPRAARDAGMEETRANGVLDERPGSIDVVVLGDSEAYRSISPLLLWKNTGYTSYVCATSSQKLTYTKTMLGRALKKQKPKLVILETLAIYRHMTLGDILFNEMAEQFPVFRYHNQWKNMLKKDHGSTVDAEDIARATSGKGHLFNNSVDPCWPGAYMHQTGQREKIPMANRLFVQSIQRMCDKAGAKLLLVSSPSPINWSYKRHNGIEAFAGELGCDYIDLNLRPELGIDWSKDTYDKGDHLNHAGAVKVTNYLSSYLQKQGLLTDHRGDPDYAGWDSALQNYEKMIASKSA